MTWIEIGRDPGGFPRQIPAEPGKNHCPSADRGNVDHNPSGIHRQHERNPARPDLPHTSRRIPAWRTGHCESHDHHPPYAAAVRASAEATEPALAWVPLPL